MLPGLNFLILCLPYYFVFVRAIRETCESEIFCKGELLHAVQVAKIFNDSKTFVDLKVRKDVRETLYNFDVLMGKTSNKPSKEEIKIFVEENFENEDELEEWTPPDFQKDPPFLDNICDEEVKEYASQIHNLWGSLGRKVRQEVLENSELYSLIAVPNGFIIPGGRFREIYYWDSYWIIKGLLISGMHETARGMLDNLIFMVKQHGYVPNGSRIYYKRRSQPPLLTSMVSEYVMATNDTEWVEDNIKYLEIELRYWVKQRSINIRRNNKVYRLARYNAPSMGPRPEAYSEDLEAASPYDMATIKQRIYDDLKSAAESGWDFSSRWMFDMNGGREANLSSVQTQRVIPVDLNAFLYAAFSQLSTWYASMGNLQKSEEWDNISRSWRDAITNALWSEEDGIWYDFDIKTSKPIKHFYVSNLTPLWTDAFNYEMVEKVLNYIGQKGLTRYFGGIPTSLFDSGEQWDFPNAWPPYQAIVVQGLENTGLDDAKILAEQFAKNWVMANKMGFEETGVMFEKYDSLSVGGQGGGGEYEVQSGFGWANGVVLEFITKYYTCSSN